MVFAVPEQPKTELGRYRILSSTAGVRVSPIALGALSLGKSWSLIMGTVDEEQSFELLDAYTDAGGNFIDTANNYQNEDSEKYIGKWMAARGNRDLLFIATKFTNSYRTHELGTGKTVSYGGNHKKISSFIDCRFASQVANNIYRSPLRSLVGLDDLD